jgi:hypothetical protein
MNHRGAGGEEMEDVASSLLLGIVMSSRGATFEGRPLPRVESMLSKVESSTSILVLVYLYNVTNELVPWLMIEHPVIAMDQNSSPT